MMAPGCDKRAVSVVSSTPPPVASTYPWIARLPAP
jgi:hypothetical protein